MALEEQGVLASLIAQLNDFIVVVCDSECVIRSWHPAIAAQLGYSAEELLGKPLSLLISSEVPISSQAGIPETELFCVFNKEGDRVMMSGVTIPMAPLCGQTSGFVKILRSVTSLHDTEDASRGLMEALEHSNVLIRRWEGPIEHWSAGCEELYGFSAGEAVGKTMQALLHTEYPIATEELKAELEQHHAWRGELKQIRKDGSPVYVSAQIVLLRQNNDSQPLIVCTHSDISSRLQMQQELESANGRLKRMADELERSNEELEEFARIASHDLSAPITTTRWLVDVLSSRHSQQLDEDGKKCLKQIGLSLARMADLVEAVLQHAKVGTSAIGASEEADTELAVEAALENLRRDVETSGARVTYDQLPPLLIGQQPLTQLFQNLLSNAIKYRKPEAAPAVSITAERSGDQWRLAVADNGMGVEEQWRERIFLPMQRLHGSKIAGSGIGLATCRKIVNRAGGRIWVEAGAEGGSIFYFTLPALVTQPV